MNISNVSAGAGATQIIQVKPKEPEELEPSFFKTSTYESYKNINPERVPKTCIWFLEHPTFQIWKNSTRNDLLWLSADPGCGKSVLARALIDENSKEKLVSPEPITLCYFFFKDNEAQNSATTALCALLHQILCAHSDLLQKRVAPAYEKCGEALKNDFEELWRTFISVATDASAGDVVCILDALDECKEADRSKLIRHLEHFYRSSDSMSRRGSKLKFLVTSRPYGDIEIQFTLLELNVPTTRLAGEDESERISNEIGLVIHAKVKEIAVTCKLSDRLRSFLYERLCEIPNRTYLWLHLTLEEVRSKIRKGKTEKKILAIINTLSSTVEEAYQAMLERCGDKEEARRILQIIVAARRPLTVGELDIALELEPHSTAFEDLDFQYESRKESIRENCGLFVTIVDSRVYLIHQTAREFLIRNNNALSGVRGWKHSVNLQEAHQVLLERCVASLLLSDFQPLPDSTKADSPSVHDSHSTNQQHPSKDEFFVYSAEYWISHVREAGTDSTSWVQRTARLCDIHHLPTYDWLGIYKRANNFRPFYTPGRTALYWAVALGLIDETRFFLDSSSDCNLQENELGGIALEAALNRDYGNELMVLILDRRGADIPVTEDLVVAILNKLDKDVVALFLDRRVADVPITEKVLKAAIAKGKDAITPILRYGRAGSPVTEGLVQRFVKYVNKDVAALLLDRWEADVPITEKVVKAAATNRRHSKDVITLLLDRWGADVPITEEIVNAIANRSNGKEITTLLLDRQDVDVLNMEEVVKAVIANNRKDIMTLIIDRREREVISALERIAADEHNRPHRTTFSIELLSAKLLRIWLKDGWIYHRPGGSSRTSRQIGPK